MLRPIHLKLLVALLLTVAAQATPRTWYLQQVTFTDGGTATGSFVYDADTHLVSSVNITTTYGTGLQSTIYTLVPTFLLSGGDLVWGVPVLQTDMTGVRFLDIVVAPRMTNDGGTVQITGLGEGYCGNSGCTGFSVTHLFASGSISTTPPVNPFHLYTFFWFFC